jgi:uncharacterized RDD family membrane protein YckC
MEQGISASRGSRFLAYLIDKGLLVLVVGVIGLLLAILIPKVAQSLPVGPDGKREEVIPILAGLAIGIVGTLPLAIVQMVMLARHGQTIGKRALKIKIVRMTDGENGGFATNVLMREVLGRFIAYIPYLGIIYGLVDDCLIFKEDSRCLHDGMAGTRVVKVE